MLGLILPHGHEVGIVDEDVRCHQHGVGEQTAVDVVGVLGTLILELGHARQLTKLRVAGQHPGKLGVRGHVALYKQNMLLRVDAYGQQQGGQLTCAAAQVCGHLAHGQAVQVGHHVQAVVIGLQEGPVAHRTDVVAQSRRAGGLNARKNAFTFFFCHYDVSPL